MHDQKDLVIVSLRLIVLQSGFYFLCGASLLLTIWLFTNAHHAGFPTTTTALPSSAQSTSPLELSLRTATALSQFGRFNHSTAGPSLSADNTSSQRPVQVTVEDLCWLGLRTVPSAWWFVVHRTMVLVPLVLLVNATLDTYRSVLDYVSTIYVLHCVVMFVTFGLPRSVTWWMAVIVEGIAAVTFGEFAVARSERNSFSRVIRRLEGDASDDSP